MAWCFSTRASVTTVLSAHPCVSSCLWVKSLWWGYAIWHQRSWSSFFQSWWRHQMETFSALLALCEGNSPVTGEFPHKGQWRGALMFSLICTSTNRWVINRDTGDLRCHWAYCDITVMVTACCQFSAKPLKDPMLEDCNSLVFCNKCGQSMDFTRTFVTKSFQNLHGLHLIEQQ